MQCLTCGDDNPTYSQFCGTCGENLISPEDSVGTKLPMVGFGEAVSSGFRKYSTFSGRATRAEFWWWQLFANGAALGLGIVDVFLTGGFALFLFALGILIPSVSVSVRRLHDINRSGWILLLPYGVLFSLIVANIPFIGILFYVWVVWLGVQRGEVGTNIYGPDPSRIQSTTAV